MSKESERHFKKAIKCQICNKLYFEQDIRIRDHCHITGGYRDLAHQICNANFRLTIKIPAIFHNSGQLIMHSNR